MAAVVVVSLGAGQLCHAQGANKDDLAATVSRLNKKALDEYENLNFEEARKILKDALEFCREAGLEQHPVTARTNMHLGVVTLIGFKQRDAAAKYFRKSLEIQPDIKLTKSLANPEIQAAFDDAAATMVKSTAGKAVAKPGPATVAVAAKPGAESVIAHEPVTRAAQGRSVPISATIDPLLNADKIVLSYRAADAADFVARDMTEATPGNFTAEIPSTATAGGQVAYLIEAQKGGQPVANLGSTASPLVVTLTAPPAVGIQLPRKEPAGPARRQEPGKMYVGLAVGTGVGWASGAGEINAMHVADPAGFAPAQIVHLAPEVGYFLRPDLLLSVQGRIQFVTGLTSQNCTGCAAPPSSAIAAFAKLTWLFGSDKLKPYVSAAVGGGRIRYVAKFPQYPSCGANGTSTCVESLPSGSIMLGPGGGVFYSVTSGFGLLVGANTQLGFPHFTFNVDFNVGLAAQF